jgi:hypothetical protein
MASLLLCKAALCCFNVAFCLRVLLAGACVFIYLSQFMSLYFVLL